MWCFKKWASLNSHALEIPYIALHREEPVYAM
jgi:hypothetical protein